MIVWDGYSFPQNRRSRGIGRAALGRAFHDVYALVRRSLQPLAHLNAVAMSWCALQPYSNMGLIGSEPHVLATTPLGNHALNI